MCVCMCVCVYTLPSLSWPLYIRSSYSSISPCHVTGAVDESASETKRGFPQLRQLIPLTIGEPASHSSSNIYIHIIITTNMAYCTS